VIEDFDGRIEFIIDTGDVEVGVESTVLDMSADMPVILRPGGVTREMLAEVLPDLCPDSYLHMEENKTETPRSPGTKYAHYSPKAEVIVIDGDSIDSISARISMMAAGYEAQGIKAGIMATDETERVYISKNVLSMGSRTRPDTIAASIYRLLREFDSLGAGVILVEAVEADGIGAAIMNRLEKAAGGRIVDADGEII
jgi:L-threonylcarbamoyladenylate synthase